MLSLKDVCACAGNHVFMRLPKDHKTVCLQSTLIICFYHLLGLQNEPVEMSYVLGDAISNGWVSIIVTILLVIWQYFTRFQSSMVSSQKECTGAQWLDGSTNSSQRGKGCVRVLLYYGITGFISPTSRQQLSNAQCFLSRQKRLLLFHGMDQFLQNQFSYCHSML